jgi:hypothetical protein
MSWAKHAIQALQDGKEVQIRPRGHSMKGKVNDGALVTLRPIGVDALNVDDIVLVRVKAMITSQSDRPRALRDRQ